MPDEFLLPVPDEQFLGPTVVLPEDEVTEEKSPLDELDSEFDPRFREDFTGMLYLGKMETECRIAGHTFLLATPDQSFRLAMGPLHKPYVNTLSAEHAWATIVVAAYLRKIDSEDRPEGLRGPVELREVWQWVITSIHSPLIINKIFDHCLLLDARTRQLVEELDSLGEP